MRRTTRMRQIIRPIFRDSMRNQDTFWRGSVNYGTSGCCKCLYIMQKSSVQMAGGKCPDCGGDTISLLHTPKSWNALADEQKRAVIEKAFQKVQKTQDPTASPEDECPITTTDSFENEEIEKYLDTVSGTDIYLVGGVLGGGLANQEKLFGTAFTAAKSRMLEKARLRGGNAVVGMSLSVTPAATNNVFVIVTGTAVKLKDKT